MAGITISKAAAIKLPIIPTAELFATSAEKSAASNKFEIWNTFLILNSQFIIRIKYVSMGYLLRWVK